MLLSNIINSIHLLSIATLKPQYSLDLEKTQSEYNDLASLVYLGVGLIALLGLLLVPSFETKPIVYSYTAYVLFVFFYNKVFSPGFPLSISILQIPLGLAMIISLQWLMPLDLFHLTLFLFPIVFLFVFEFHKLIYMVTLFTLALVSVYLIIDYRQVEYIPSYLITTFGSTLLIGLVVKKSAEKTEFLAHYDALTGLMNRRYWEQSLRYLINLSERDKSSLAVAYLDLDDFKIINDNQGHSKGDEVLISVANILKVVCRDTDLIGRWGGDEFAIIMPNTTQEQANHLVTRLEKNMSHIKFSVGVVTFKPDESMDTLLSRADKAMYAVKSQHKKMNHNTVQAD